MGYERIRTSEPATDLDKPITSESMGPRVVDRACHHEQRALVAIVTLRLLMDAGFEPMDHLAEEVPTPTKLLGLLLGFTIRRLGARVDAVIRPAGRT